MGYGSGLIRKKNKDIPGHLLVQHPFLIFFLPLTLFIINFFRILTRRIILMPAFILASPLFFLESIIFSIGLYCGINKA